MWNSKKILALVTTIATVFCLDGAVAEAGTLYKNTFDMQTQSSTWFSPIEGTVDVSGFLTETYSGLDVSILFNGVDLLAEIESQNSEANSSSNHKSDIEFISTIDVLVGSKLEFIVNPKGFNWGGELDVSVDLQSDTGLVFLSGNNTTTFDHVGLLSNGKIYESSPAYQGEIYRDVITQELRTIVADDGVQDRHSLGSFIHLSPDADSSPIHRSTLVDISSEYGEDAVKKLEDYIKTQLDKGYAETPYGVPLLNPYKQKGQYGNDYTGIGLIEGAAEEVGLGYGEGFIPDDRESIAINQIISHQNWDGIPWECLEVFPTTVDCQSYYSDRDLTSSREMSMLSPAYLHYILENGPGNWENWLQGWFKSIDFMITDPLGRRLGRTEDLGVINEITYINDRGKEVSAFYSQTEDVEHIYIPERLEGTYLIQFYGACDDGSIAAFGDNKDGTLIAGCNEKEKERVPEPTMGLGLLVLGLFGILSRKQLQRN